MYLYIMYLMLHSVSDDCVMLQLVKCRVFFLWPLHAWQLVHNDYGLGVINMICAPFRL